MAGFWFLVSVVLLIMLLSGRKKNDSYAQGYWNGYRAFGDKVDELISKGRADVHSLRRLINEGRTGSVSTDSTPSQSQLSNDTEAQFIADTYAADEQFEETDVVEDYAVAATTPVVQYVELTAEQKAKRSLRNLNIILYTASFLLVAAGALFVASSSSPQTKLITVISIISLFYVGGFVMHAKSERLRPAALAFLGTGLALIPFAGLALQQFTNLSATQSWLITSVAGLIAYFVVAVRLQSQLVAYLTMAFVLSLVGSMTATAASALVWQFMVMIVVSLSASIVAHFKPGWVPKVFSAPIERSGQIVTPVVLVASLFVFDKLLITDYEVVFAVATLHYVVAWLQTRNITYETTIRVLSYAVLALITWDIFDGNMPVIAFVMFLLMTFQHAFSLYMVNQPGRASNERTWMTILFIVQAFLMLFWLNHYLAPVFTTIGLTVIGLTSLVVAVQLRTVWAGLIGLVASLILPFVVVRDLITPSLPWWVITAVFMAAAVAGLYLYARWRHRSVSLRYFMTVAYLAYLAFAVITAWIEGSAMVVMVTYFATAIVSLAASYIARKPYGQIAFPIFVFLGVILFAEVLHIMQPWNVLFIGGVSAVVFWLMTLMHGYFRQSIRQVTMLASGQFALLVTAGVMLCADTSANTFVVSLLLIASFASLMLRWVYKERAIGLSRVFAYSYVTYFVAALMMTAVISSGWMATATGLGVLLFVLASYVERQPWQQIIASLLTISTLGIVASIIALPMQWFALFTFGIAAALFYAATGLHFAYKQAQRQLVMATTAQITLFFIIFAGMSGHYIATLTSFIILLVWAVVSLAVRWWCRDRSSTYSQLFLASYPVYYFGTLLLLSSLSTVWSVIAFAVGVIVFWVASYAERLPALVLVGNVFLAIALSVFWWWMNFSSDWMILGIVWILAAVFYFGHWILKGLGDSWRSQVLLGSTWVVLVGGSVLQFFVASKTIAVASTLIAFALTLAVEGRRLKRDGMIEAAIYVATFGMQRIAGHLWPELNVVLYAHWWAIIIALVAITRQTYRRERLVVAMSFVTLSSGIYALMNGGNYQLLFLIEHLALLVAGALLSKSWAIWWGIVASALAILYFLRTYTFLLLGFLGLLLIAIVVWRLMRNNTAVK